MKIAHEAPNCIFDLVNDSTDYSYALVHLFEENNNYLQNFKNAVYAGREVILDNSIFELGEAFDSKKYAMWIEELKPTWYIVPDVLEDHISTIANFYHFCKKYSDLPGKKIGVVQGKTYEEIVECYKFMSINADMVAISFDYSLYEEWFPKEPTKYHSWMKGRQELLRRLQSEGVIDLTKKHHLLGCGLPQEFSRYKHFSYIYSIDTSNPVIHGMKNIRYTKEGLDNKESVKLCTLIDAKLSVEQIDDIIYNIEAFKSFCKVIK